MKLNDCHFEDYINENNKNNLHDKLNTIYNHFPENIQDFKNIIFYGPPGIGKYTQMLKSIQKYSPSNLKYERKISILFNKQQYYFKVSDIHYEVDMSLLGCNSKLLWYEIYQQFIDIISTKTHKSGIIVCKYFHEINSELLDNFYSYTQEKNSIGLNIQFILITEHLSFIPDNIMRNSQVINIPRPTKTIYNKCMKKKIDCKLDVKTITNIKNLHTTTPFLSHIMLCDKLIYYITNIHEVQFLKFRDMIYDLFIYNLDIYECVWYIVTKVIENKYLKNNCIDDVLIYTYTFLQYYNNNYRPIYHFEKYLFYLSKQIHGF